MNLVNGLACDTITTFDRGLLYGDGLFETTAVADGRILNWSRHVARLHLGCERLGLPIPDDDLLRTEVLRCAGATERCVVRIIWTRGQGGRAYTPALNVVPTRIIARRAWPSNIEANRNRGIRVGIAQQRLGINPSLAGIKHLCRLEQVLASRELSTNDLDDVLMLDSVGSVIESTRCNLFVISRDTVSTPLLNDCGVRGVMRANVLEFASQCGLKSRERKLSVADLESADAMF